MTEENKKKIYEAVRNVCDTAVTGWDAGWDVEIDEDNFEEIVDEQLIPVIDEICQSVCEPDDDGHYIDDPLLIASVKPDFEGMGLPPVHNNKKQ